MLAFPANRTGEDILKKMLKTNSPPRGPGEYFGSI